MIVTQTPADIFIGVLEAIAGGVIVVLCAKYYPLTSDYWSERSISARRRRIKVLENILAKYENDFAWLIPRLIPLSQVAQYVV
jgi:hypothetical protein